MVFARSTLLGALVLFASTAAASPEIALIARQTQADSAATVSSSVVTTTAAATTATGTATAPTEVTGCHTHSDGYYCFEGDAEWEVTSDITDTADAPEEYSNCQAGSNDDMIQCADGSGGQVTLIREGSEMEGEGGDHDHDHSHDGSSGSTTASGAASTTAMESGTGAAAESPSSTTANGGNVIFPASGMSLAALLAYLL